METQEQKQLFTFKFNIMTCTFCFIIILYYNGMFGME
jgi:hypothetical protein